MKILGLDPSNQCGFAHSCGVHGVWQLKKTKDKRHGSRYVRLRENIYEIYREHGIQLIAAEDASFGSRQRNVIASHGAYRGQLQLIAAELEIPIALYKPKEIKSWLTGRGNANKETMIYFVKAHFDIVTDDDNVADAVAIMEMAKEQLKKKD